MLEEASRLTESVEIKEELIDVEDDTVESVSVTKDQNQTKWLPIVKNITQDNYDDETVQKKTKTNDEPDDGTGSNTAMENKVNKIRASKSSKENLGKCTTNQPKPPKGIVIPYNVHPHHFLTYLTFLCS